MAIMVRYHRGNLTQREFAQLIWPGDNEVLARNRIAKYEKALAMPPADVYFRIKEAGDNLRNSQ